MRSMSLEDDPKNDVSEALFLSYNTLTKLTCLSYPDAQRSGPVSVARTVVSCARCDYDSPAADGPVFATVLHLPDRYCFPSIDGDGGTPFWSHVPACSPEVCRFAPADSPTVMAISPGRMYWNVPPSDSLCPGKKTNRLERAIIIVPYT